MTDQVARESSTSFHGGFNLATCQLTSEIGEFLLIDGRTDNLHLVDTEEGGILQPVGFARFTNAGITFELSGMVPNNQFIPGGHALILFVRNDGSVPLVLLDQDANSAPDNRFVLGGNTPLNPGAIAMLFYLDNITRWGMFFHT